MIQTRLSAEQWERLLREQSVSGLSVAAFCRRAQVSPASFYYWRNTLRGDRPGASVRRPRKRAGRFVELKVSAEPPVDPSARRDADMIELRLPGRRRVRIRPGFDRRTLLDLLALLEACPPRRVTREVGA